jgi:hypothetical protein
VAQRRSPARDEGRCVLGRRLPSDLRVRARAIVIGVPDCQGDARRSQGCEQGLIEQFIPQAAVEVLDEAVLHRRAKRDVMPFDIALIGPRLRFMLWSLLWAKANFKLD